MKNQSNPDYTKIITQLTDCAAQVVFAFDVTQNVFIYLNPPFEPMWNRAVQGILTNPELLLDTIHPEEKDFVVNSYQDFLKGIAKKDVEFRILWLDKTQRWVCLTPSFIKGQQDQQIKGALGSPARNQ